MEQRCRGIPLGRPRQLLDRAVGELREILHGSPECRERCAAGLVRDRDGDVSARRERFEQCPFHRGQILEAVRQDGRVLPRGEIGSQPFHRAAPQRSAVLETEGLQLLPIRACEPREIASHAIRIDERGLELPESRHQRVAEPGSGGGACELLELRTCDGAPGRKLALDLGRDALAAARIGDVLEEIVERPDVPGKKSSPPANEIALDPFDVRPVRHDEPGVAIETREKAVEKQRDLARVRRADDQGETHPSIVVPASGALSYAATECAQRA